MAVLRLSISLAPLIGLIIGALFCWSLYRVIYNVYFHPLSKFPGSKLAAATRWYSAYFDILVSPGGQFMHEIERMHKEYGPIIRVTPDELHIKDHTFHEKLYAFGSKRDKSHRYAHIFGVPTAIFSTANHDIHKMRRAALNPFFSKQSIVRMDLVIQSKVRQMCDQMSVYMRRNKCLRLRDAFSATVIDIITEYSYGQCEGALEDPDFSPMWDLTLCGCTEMAPVLRQLPGLIHVLTKIPFFVLDRYNPYAANLKRFEQRVRHRVEEIFARYTTQEGEFDPTKIKEKGVDQHTRSIFHEILDSSLPLREKNVDHMTDEAISIQSAAVETTGIVLSTVTFYILDNSAIYQRLKRELQEAIPDASHVQDWKTLESLPYLTACLKEGLRIASPITSRLPLSCPTTTLTYTCPTKPDDIKTPQTYFIPPGTLVSMSIRDISLSPDIYPDPLVFDPSRWLPNDDVVNNEHSGKEERKYSDAQRRIMESCLKPFNMGPRNCLGINLAWADLYGILAAMIRRFDLELVDTIRSRDVDIVRDNFSGKPSKESRGVMVKLVKDHAAADEDQRQIEYIEMKNELYEKKTAY